MITKIKYQFCRNAFEEKSDDNIACSTAAEAIILESNPVFHPLYTNIHTRWKKDIYYQLTITKLKRICLYVYFCAVVAYTEGLRKYSVGWEQCIGKKMNALTMLWSCNIYYNIHLGNTASLNTHKKSRQVKYILFAHSRKI